MGSNSASSGSSDSPNTSRSTLSKKNQAKADKKSRADANVEMGLGKDRMSNYSTGQGGTRSDGGEGAGAENVLKGNLVPGGVGIVAKSGESLRAVTPIISEASNEDTIETRKKKAKATGRSVTILNRAKGISSDEGLTLGKRSLLGS